MVAPPDDGGRLKIAGRLRKMAAWAHFTDEQIFSEINALCAWE